MGGKYTLNFSESEKLVNEMKKIPERSEKVVNEILHSQSSERMIESIVGFMPRSDRNKRHAKDSNPLKSDNLNLGFRIYARGGAAKNKGSFGYLVFPDEGRGSSNPIAQEFFEHGAKSVEKKILEDVLNGLIKAQK